MLRTVADKSGWTALRLSPLEFRCQVTLTNGQSFAWQPCAFHDTRPVQWRGVLQRHVITISESDDDAFYRVECADSAHQTDIDVMLRDYLRSNVSLHSLTRNWSTADKRFAQIAPYFGGCRLLRQHPAECLFSFLCSSNNNIPRITQMLSALRSNFGTPLGEVDQQAYFAFPTLTQLSSASEERLRELGFGYRAKFIVESTKTIISNGGEDWLMALRHKSREETHEALQQLCGVGPKVADCVALFSLDKLDVVPVDVHVWKIAAQDYGAEFEAGFADRSLTKRIYTQIGDFFRRRLGDHCGWAHSVLFTADLSSFQHRLPQELRRMLPAVSALPGKQAKSKKSKAASAAKTENSGDTTESDVESKPPAPKKKRATQPNVKVEAKSEPSDLVQ